jgi:hypothetical protein
MPVFPRFFWFYRIFRCFLAMGAQKHHKTFWQKIQNRFFLNSFYHVFGSFSVRRVRKQHQTNVGGEIDPDPVLAFDPPTHHEGPWKKNWRLLGEGPWLWTLKSTLNAEEEEEEGLNAEWHSNFGTNAERGGPFFTKNLKTTTFLGCFFSPHARNFHFL